MPGGRKTDEQEWINNRKKLLDICRSLAENADCDEKIKENEQNRLYEMVNELSHTYFNILAGKKVNQSDLIFLKEGLY